MKYGEVNEMSHDCYSRLELPPCQLTPSLASFDEVTSCHGEAHVARN